MVLARRFSFLILLELKIRSFQLVRWLVLATLENVGVVAGEATGVGDGGATGESEHNVVAFAGDRGTVKVENSVRSGLIKPGEDGESEYGKGVQAYGTGVVNGWGALIGPMVRALSVLFGLLVFEPGLERLDVQRRSWCIGELAEAEEGERDVADDVDGGLAAAANKTRLIERPIGWDDRVWLSWSPDAGVVLTR